uniref:CBM39 domain-containing protein n=1 Tax=Anopheles epiroticus TaxID=199890 RepID=A0A182PDC9_9DIPT
MLAIDVILQQVCCHGHGRHNRGRYYQGHYEHHGHHGHHRHHRRPHHWIPPPNIDIYSPKGIEVSIPRWNGTSQYFAFEMFINNPDGGTPDVAHNTTELVYGKFIVRDTEVIIRQGDALNVTTYMGFTDGGVLKNTYSFHVFTRTTTTAATTTSTSSSTDWNRDQVIGGDYSDEDFDCVIDPTTNLCAYGSLIDERSGSRPQKLCVAEPRTNLLILDGVEDAYDPTVDWIGNVGAVLKQLPKLGKVAESGLVSAGRHGKVVVFQMDTLLTKLLVLYHAQEAGIKCVSDYDDVKIVGH